jgi:hypothetical protein
LIYNDSDLIGALPRILSVSLDLEKAGFPVPRPKAALTEEYATQIARYMDVVGTLMDGVQLEGDVEIDGAFFGGYIKPENEKADRIDRRLKENLTGKRKAVVVMRERKGRTLTAVFDDEGDAHDTIVERVRFASNVYADEASCWDPLHARFNMGRINHSVQYSDNGICTNQAESFFSRLRRMEIGTHHHISGRYLHQYAGEAAWREDNRRKANGTLYVIAARAALTHPVSEAWTGYWQRGRA